MIIQHPVVKRIQADISGFPQLMRLVTIAEQIDYRLGQFHGYEAAPYRLIAEQETADKISNSNVNWEWNVALKKCCSQKLEDHAITIPNSTDQDHLGAGAVRAYVDKVARKNLRDRPQGTPAFITNILYDNLMCALKLYLAGLHDTEPYRVLEEAVLKRYVLLRWDGPDEGPINEVILHAPAPEAAD